MPSPSTIAAFRTRLAGRVLTPEDAGYDSARQVFNAMIDRRPTVIAQCREPEDVAAAVLFAHEQGMPLSVRGGGHSVAGRAVCDGGLMIDLSAMKSVRIDPQARSALAQPGLTLGELDRASEEHGLATPLGIVSGTGISGLTLGGGIGWLNGRYGLACDNVNAFEIVTADEKRLTVNAGRHDDLFWALRGGSGNFGVVTSIEYRLHPVGPVLAGPIFHPLAHARDALNFFLEFSAAAPDELTTTAALVTLPDGTPAVALACCYCGSAAAGERVVAPLRAFGSPLADHLQAMPYTGVQSMLDGFFPPGRRHYWKSSLTRSASCGPTRWLETTTCHTPSRNSGRRRTRRWPALPSGGTGTGPRQNAPSRVPFNSMPAAGRSATVTRSFLRRWDGSTRRLRKCAAPANSTRRRWSPTLAWDAFWIWRGAVTRRSSSTNLRGDPRFQGLVRRVGLPG